MSSTGRSLKFLVDTGASASFINPELTDPDTHEIIDPILITTVFNKHKLNRQVTLSAFKEFNTEEKFKFLVFKFHSYFDGLIGLEMMKRLQAKVNLKDKLLETSKSVIPLQFKPNYISKYSMFLQTQKL